MDLERDFAAWADRRDAAALARVFDATAGKLLLLAAHVAPRGTAPEDLVQATFLAAMVRGGFDARRPLWPWLATILHNEANMARRREARRREVELRRVDDGGDASSRDASGRGTGATNLANLTGIANPANSAPDPAQIAASEEAFAAVLTAIDALPLPYRQVLRLRLVHCLEPIDIARALEVPVGTVRSQLHRGLAQLRAALPAGVATGLGALLLGDGALLAQVKAELLARAAGLGPAAAGATAGAAAGATTTGATATALLATGGTAMFGKKLTLAIGLVAMLLLLAAVFGVPPAFARTPRTDEPVEPVAAALPEAVPGLDAGGEQAAQRTVADAPSGGPAWPLVVTVRGADARPIEGAEVRVRVAPRGIHIENVPQGEYRREEVASGLTAADGTFRCDLDAFRARSALFRGTSHVFLSATSRDGASPQRVLALPRDLAPRIFAEDLPIDSSRGLVGRVVDAAGQPVAGAEFAVLHDKEHNPGSPCHERSGADGRFRLVLHDYEEEGWNTGVLAMHPSLGVATARVPVVTGEADPAVERDVGTLVLDARNAIRGQVVLGDGSPLGGCEIEVRRIDPSQAANVEALQVWLRRADRSNESAALPSPGHPFRSGVETTTAPDGSFCCAGLAPEAHYAVAVRDSALRYIAVPARPGDHAVRLVVERQLVAFAMRDEGGDLLPGIELYAEGYDPGLKHPVHEPRPGFPATGLVVGRPNLAAIEDGRLCLLSPFGFVWRIAVRDECAEPLVLRHDAIAGVYRAERTMVLRPVADFGVLRIVAVDEAGRPLAGYGAELRCRDRDLHHNDRVTVLPPGGRSWDLQAGRWHVAIHLGKLVVWTGTVAVRARGVQEHEVVIESNRTTELRVTAEPKGAVAFRLRAEQPPVNGWRLDGVTVHASGAPVDLLHDPRRPRRGDGGPLAAENLMFYASQALPPGRHAFVVAAEGFHPAHCAVEVVADRLTTIDVHLDPR